MSEYRGPLAQRDVYRDVTDRIVEAIERGAPRFEMPWHRGHGASGRPINASTGALYRGVNVVALWVAAEQAQFTAQHWATYQQWQDLGAHVRKGEHGSLVIFYKPLPPEGEEAEDEGREGKRARRVLRCSFVFNANQVEGWSIPDIIRTDQVEILARVETLVRSTRADIRHRGDVACFNAPGDFIEMPARDRFVGTATSSATEGYYATLLHELTHWTGHGSRLRRLLGSRFGSAAYAMEELIAELGAAFLCADLGVTNVPRPDHAAYIASWLDVLKRDRRALFETAGKAAIASEYLLGLERRMALAET